MSYDFTGFKLTQKNENTFLFHKSYDDGSFDCNGHIFFHFLPFDQGMAITGDFGSWVLSRQFHPKLISRLSRNYFLEKVHNKEAVIFDINLLNKEIQEYIEEELKGTRILDSIDFSLFDYESECNYYDNIQEDLKGLDINNELESLPNGRKPCAWITNIMDAYDYIFDTNLEVIKE